jgi:hypothetical protein
VGAAVADEGGNRFVVSTVPPGTVRSPERMDAEALMAEMEAKPPRPARSQTDR